MNDDNGGIWITHVELDNMAAEARWAAAKLQSVLELVEGLKAELDKSREIAQNALAIARFQLEQNSTLNRHVELLEDQINRNATKIMARDQAIDDLQLENVRLMKTIHELNEYIDMMI